MNCNVLITNEATACALAARRESETLTPLKSEILKVDDLSHEARRFRTILWSFERNMDLLFKDTGLTAQVDHVALAEAFSRWRLAFDNSKYLASAHRRDFVIYAAGLMLKELVAASPLKAVEGKEGSFPSCRSDSITG